MGEYGQTMVNPFLERKPEIFNFGGYCEGVLENWLKVGKTSYWLAFVVKKNVQSNATFKFVNLYVNRLTYLILCE